MYVITIAYSVHAASDDLRRVVSAGLTIRKSDFVCFNAPRRTLTKAPGPSRLGSYGSQKTPRRAESSGTSAQP